MTNRSFIAAVCAAIAPMAAQAADSFYLTAAGGYSWAQMSKLAASHGDGFDLQTGSGQSGHHGAWRVGAGWFVLPRVALELAYADYGKQSFSVAGVPSPTLVPEALSERRDSERKVRAAVLDMVGHWPVRERFTLIGRVGAAYGLVKTTSRIEAPGGFPFGSGPQSASFDSRTRSWAFHAAGGVRWADVLPTVDVEAMLEYLGPVGKTFSADSLDTTGRSRQTTVWLGLVKRF